MSNSSDHKGSTHGEFSVCQFFKPGAPLQDSEYEYTRRFVEAKEAVDAFFHYCSSVAVQMGWVTRVIITDGSDSINLEWTYAEGITYPPEQRGRLKPARLPNDTGRGSGVRESSSVPNPVVGSGRAHVDRRAYDDEFLEQDKATQAREGSRRGDNAADES